MAATRPISDNEKLTDNEKRFIKLLKKIDKEVNLATELSDRAKLLYDRKKSDAASNINRLTSENKKANEKAYAKLHYLVIKSPGFKKKLLSTNQADIDLLNAYYIKTLDLLRERKATRKHPKTGLYKQFREANNPEFFEKLFGYYLLGPIMVTFLVSTIMMCYMTIIEVTAGGWFVLSLASVQAFYYAMSERDHNVSLLSSIGAYIDDLLFHFSWQNLSINQLYMFLGLTFTLGVSVGFAAAILTFAAPIALIAAWPIIFQYAVLTGIGLFLSSVAFQIGKDVYSIYANSKSKSMSKLFGKLVVGTISGLVIAVLALAEAAEQLGMLAALINIGATAQLFVASYGLWYFISRQMSSSYKVDHYSDKFEEVTFESIYARRWQILEFVVLGGVILGLTAMLLNPPLVIAPSVAKLGLSALPEIQQFVVTFGIASIITLSLQPIIDTISFIIFGEAPDVNADKTENTPDDEFKVDDLFVPNRMEPQPIKELNTNIATKLGFFISVPTEDNKDDFEYKETLPPAHAMV